MGPTARKESMNENLMTIGGVATGGAIGSALVPPEEQTAAAGYTLATEEQLSKIRQGSLPTPKTSSEKGKKETSKQTQPVGGI